MQLDGERLDLHLNRWTHILHTWKLTCYEVNARIKTHEKKTNPSGRRDIRQRDLPALLVCKCKWPWECCYILYTGTVPMCIKKVYTSFRSEKVARQDKGNTSSSAISPETSWRVSDGSVPNRNKILFLFFPGFFFFFLQVWHDSGALLGFKTESHLWTEVRFTPQTAPPLAGQIANHSLGWWGGRFQGRPTFKNK